MLGVLNALLLSFAPAPATLPAPLTPAPKLQFVTMNDRGELLVTYYVTEAITVLESRDVNVNGKIVKVEVTVQKTVQVEKKGTLNTKGMKVATVDGKELEAADLPKFLKNGGVVILSTIGEKIDPAYLRAFKDGTLILSTPKEIPSMPKPKESVSPPQKQP